MLNFSPECTLNQPVDTSSTIIAGLCERTPCWPRQARRDGAGRPGALPSEPSQAGRLQWEDQLPPVQEGGVRAERV